METIRELINNDAFVIGTAIFLAGLTVAVVGYIDLKLRKKTA